MKIVIGLNENGFINKGHFGHSNEYIIFEYENGNFTEIERRINPLVKEHKHAKVEEILEIVGDCEVWVAKNMGKMSMLKLKEKNYKPILVDTDIIEKALNKIKEML
ncbi:hypothetical protein OSSY52_13270 [Tepiditoga spiralis]|uniref:Dinitrogenase iron-molybdenum cofactor biosynthesis domain-containing protein n=1 Tax=Tepiditoga spiralis TaxID=2108365 RepID=A0A7G1G768_9BACT|nr:NifB/NifX family molybdenum-iron cluster-binding protein [Tepiditoga spiralis]BBE31186.1 hypothetical protein OSSY52_13270 [Tepiditoga spiralis]